MAAKVSALDFNASVFEALCMSREEKDAAWRERKAPGGNRWAGLPVFAYETRGYYSLNYFLAYIRETYNPKGKIIAWQHTTDDYASPSTGIAFYDESYPVLGKDGVLSGSPDHTVQVEMPREPRRQD